jgi:hypothetical protein
MRVGVLSSLLLVLACDPSAGGKSAGPRAPAAAEVKAAPAPGAKAAAVEARAPEAARRCLPVVAAECGCVYSCGLGTEEAAGEWSVRHEFWGAAPVKARVDRWCVDGRCTEAFFGEIVCSGICPAKPAEPNCRLVGERCEVAGDGAANVGSGAAGEAASTTPGAPTNPAVSVAPTTATTPTTAAVPGAPTTPAQKTSRWPFLAWDRAEAIAYNHVPYGPGVPLRVYDADHGWSPKIVERRPITAEQGARVVEWVIATGGELEVSKCAFPRHAVVLYAGETPVGTANVCFECGDILVWPHIDAPPDYSAWDDKQERAWARKLKKKMAGYKRVFPQWERFFRDELGLPLSPAKSMLEPF